MVNSIYDPLGLAAQVLVEVRFILQELVAMGKKTTAMAPLGWDVPLPEELRQMAVQEECTLGLGDLLSFQ